MAVRITPEIITQINNRYYELHTYAAVARELGISAGTVKKYVDPNFTPYNADNEVHFTIDMLPPIGSGIARFRGVDNFGALCIMSDEEFTEIKSDEFQKEVR